MTVAFRPLVLCYHAVSDVWRHPLAVDARTLERQLTGVLARRYRPASAEEVVAGRGRLLHVTFDDAFRSVATVIPLLRRLDVPATIFACTGYADDGRPLDVPELAADARALPDELATLGWSALRELADAGLEIGSHTITHPHLTQLSDRDLDRELRASRERLESELGRPCRFLAYPYGEHDARVRAAARAAGYEAAFGVPGKLAPYDPLAVPRVGIYRKDRSWRVLLKTSPLRRWSSADVRVPHPEDRADGAFAEDGRIRA